jgi:hypothetical protein
MPMAQEFVDCHVALLELREDVARSLFCIARRSHDVNEDKFFTGQTFFARRARIRARIAHSRSKASESVLK